jgi:hypothetical protein
MSKTCHHSVAIENPLQKVPDETLKKFMLDRRHLMADSHKLAIEGISGSENHF